MASNKSGNNGGGNGGDGKKRITRDDLMASIQAAKQAAEASVAASEVVLAAIDEHPDLGMADDPDPDQDENVLQHPVGDGGHLPLEAFMVRLTGILKQAGPRVSVTENASWLKLESRVNGHKVYLSKGKTVVGRVESTLPPELVVGAIAAERPNGRIASWIPADTSSVAEAIRMLASDKTEPVRAPIRGGIRGPEPLPPAHGPGGGGRQVRRRVVN